ncbi:MAG: hypothetical protein JXR76_20495 [Deltaproteobacteria bacterium]|nr:hypothetical protein [Deltaproteobacteria bacterium]
MHPLNCAREDAPHGWVHRVLEIKQDGLDVGREVRTTFPSDGPMGTEEITISHIFTRHKAKDVEIDRHVVQTERFLKDDGLFLRGDYTVIDESRVQLSLVGYNGEGWERIEQQMSSIESGISKSPEELKLSGDELVGYKLNEWLIHLAQRKNQTNDTPYAKSRSFYVTRLKEPVMLDFDAPIEDTLALNGKVISGNWVTARRAGTDRVVLEAFVGVDNIIHVEKYPSLHQVRTVNGYSFSVPSQYSDPYRGLYSNTYLGFPDSATSATYHIVSKTPLDIAEFAFIGDPATQKIKQIDANTLEVTVTAGGPDGTSFPDKDDLSSTKYVNTSDRTIKDAFIYLKTGGKKGNLPDHRCDNAVPVIAKSVRIEQPKKFWRDAMSVAQLVAEYVHAILPIKKHTHTMRDAVTTLKEGLGDCTEHSVLFAAIMRAARIPTRLVSGMYLSDGGIWVFHMWNEFWDGARWQSIDSAVGPKMSPGATYVALSRGAANFEKHRHYISFFLDKTYSGLQFNLIAAGANGESLHLAKPKRGAFAGTEAIIVQAITLSTRGDYSNALQLVNANYDPAVATVDLSLLRADLLYRVKRYDDALGEIVRLRQQTSLPANVLMLNKLEFDIYLAQKKTDDASRLLSELKKNLKDNPTAYIQLNAMLMATSGKISDALKMLDDALQKNEYDATIMATYLNIVSMEPGEISDQLKQKTMERAWYALYLTHYASANVLKSAAGLFFNLGQTRQAIPLIHHALTMAPNDEELLSWNETAKKICN